MSQAVKTERVKRDNSEDRRQKKGPKAGVIWPVRGSKELPTPLTIGASAPEGANIVATTPTTKTVRSNLYYNTTRIKSIGPTEGMFLLS